MSSDPSVEKQVHVFHGSTIELIPGHKYLMLLHGANVETDRDSLDMITKELKRLGFDSLVLALPDNINVTIIDQSEKIPSGLASKEAEEWQQQSLK